MNASSIRHPTSAARQALAARFALPCTSDMQDLEWAVASADRFAEFLETYRTADLTDDERFSLMEILVQCVEEFESQSSDATAWQAVAPLLLSRPELHSTTIAYWAQPDETGPIAFFNVTPAMRQIWRAIRHDRLPPPRPRRR